MKPILDGGSLSHFFAGSVHLRDKPAVEWKVGRSFKDNHRPIAAFNTKRCQHFSHASISEFAHIQPKPTFHLAVSRPSSR